MRTRLPRLATAFLAALALAAGSLVVSATSAGASVPDHWYDSSTATPGS